MNISEHLLCPDCRVKLDREGHLTCKSCGRIFNTHGNFYNLLPSHLSQEDLAEEIFWSTDPKEGLAAHLNLTLEIKRPEIDFFRERILRKLRLKGKILEIGSGACWLSSLVKLALPETFVVASDVSSSALSKGEKLSKFLNSKIDAFVACKIESLPFETDFFDYVIGSAVLHHTQPQEALTQIYRVLERNGEFVGTGETIIPRVFSTIWRSRFGLPGQRERKLGVKEGAYSFGQWKRFFNDAGFGWMTFSSRMDPKYKRGKGLTSVYFLIASHVPDSFILRYVPCVAVLVATK